MATFEERLTKLRTKAGVSQQAIGDALNAGQFTIMRRGKTGRILMA